MLFALEFLKDSNFSTRPSAALSEDNGHPANLSTLLALPVQALGTETKAWGEEGGRTWPWLWGAQQPFKHGHVHKSLWRNAECRKVPRPGSKALPPFCLQSPEMALYLKFMAACLSEATELHHTSFPGEHMRLRENRLAQGGSGIDLSWEGKLPKLGLLSTGCWTWQRESMTGKFMGNSGMWDWGGDGEGCAFFTDMTLSTHAFCRPSLCSPLGLPK